MISLGKTFEPVAAEKRKAVALVCLFAASVSAVLPVSPLLRGLSLSQAALLQGLLLCMLAGSSLLSLKNRSTQGKALAIAALFAGSGFIIFRLFASRDLSRLETFGGFEGIAGLLILLLCASCLLLLYGRMKTFRKTMLASLAGLLAFSFGVSLLVVRAFDELKLVGTTVLFPVSLSLAFLCLGVAIIALARNNIVLHPGAFKELRHSILVFCAAAIFIIALLVGGLGGFLTKSYLSIIAEQELLNINSARAGMIERGFSRVNEYVRALYTSGAPGEKSAWAPFGLLPLSGIRIEKPDGEVLIEAGETIPAEAQGISIPAGFDTFALPLSKSNGRQFVMLRGFLSPDVRYAALLEAPDFTDFRSETGFLLAFRVPGADPQFRLHAFGEPQKLTLTGKAALEMEQALNESGGRAGLLPSGLAAFDSQSRVSYAAVPRTNVLTLGVRRSGADNGLWPMLSILGAGFLVALMGTVVVYAGIGDLTKQTDALHAQLEEQKGELARELHERRAVEQVLRKSEEKAKQTAHEKELLLQEVHHRVKNNLQVISSLLSLQAKRFDNEDIKKVLKDSRNRVHTIALLHELLYRSVDLTYLDFGSYLKKIADNLLFSSRINSRVKVELDADPVTVSLDTAIPCGMIFNELLTNALTHAFPDDRKGIVDVQLRVNEGNVELTVKDNGVGAKSKPESSSPATLGTKLIQSLARQLNGRVSPIDNEHGTSVQVTFQLKEYDYANGTAAGRGHSFVGS